MKQKDERQNITGRDGYIVCKALAYAIVTIERLPDMWQELSDRDDMKKLLDHFSTSERMTHYYMTGARSHVERRGVKIGADGQMEVGDRPDTPVVEFPK